MKKILPINHKVFFILFTGSILGLIAIIPFVLLVQGGLLRTLPTPLPVILFLQVLQGAVVSGIAILVGLSLAHRLGLGAPILEAWASGKNIGNLFLSRLAIAVPMGLLAGFLILVVHATLPILIKGAPPLSVGPVSISSEQFEVPSDGSPGIQRVVPGVWEGFLGSFYGGINEEILMRLFVMTLLIWVFWKLMKKRGGKPTGIQVWPAILLSSVLFGIGHLPLTATLTALTPFIVTRALLMNGVAGIIFGWLYWKRGLEAAMIAHFTADIFLFVIVPAL